MPVVALGEIQTFDKKQTTREDLTTIAAGSAIPFPLLPQDLPRSCSLMIDVAAAIGTRKKVAQLLPLFSEAAMTSSNETTPVPKSGRKWVFGCCLGSVLFMLFAPIGCMLVGWLIPREQQLRHYFEHPGERRLAELTLPNLAASDIPILLEYLSPENPARAMTVGTFATRYIESFPAESDRLISAICKMALEDDKYVADSAIHALYAVGYASDEVDQTALDLIINTKDDEIRSWALNLLLERIDNEYCRKDVVCSFRDSIAAISEQFESESGEWRKIAELLSACKENDS